MAKAARAAVVHATEASAREAAVVHESVMTLVKEAEDWAALTEREARERVLRMELDSAVALASARREAEVFAWRIALLEGELTEACQARDTVEANSWGLSDKAATAKRRRGSPRGSARNGSIRLPSCKTRFRAVTSHSRSSEGEESPVRGNVAHCPLPHRDG
jgi:hypothetical protein